MSTQESSTQKSLGFYDVFLGCVTKAGITEEFLQEVALGKILSPEEKIRLREFQDLWTPAFGKLHAALGDMAFVALGTYAIKDDYFDGESVGPLGRSIARDQFNIC